MRHRKDSRDEMEKQVAAWLKVSIRYLAVAAVASGVSLGTQFTDGAKIAELERRVAENERVDGWNHADFSRFFAVDLSGFSDPRAVHAIDQQIQRALKDYETREHAAAWRKRLKALNPTLTVIDE